MGTGSASPLRPSATAHTSPCRPSSHLASTRPRPRQHPLQSKMALRRRGGGSGLPRLPGDGGAGSGRCRCRAPGLAGGAGRGKVRVRGCRLRGRHVGTDGVVGRLEGQRDRQTVSDEGDGEPRGSPRTPALTWRRKRRCRRLRLGGSGSCLQSRSGERVPLGPKTLRSLKHSVSIIWGGQSGAQRGRGAGAEPPFDEDAPAPRSARGWRRCRWQTWRRNRCRLGPG